MIYNDDIVRVILNLKIGTLSEQTSGFLNYHLENLISLNQVDKQILHINMPVTIENIQKCYLETLSVRIINQVGAYV